MQDFMLTLSKLEQKRIEAKVEYDPSLINAIKTDLTDSFDEEIQMKAKKGNENHIAILIYGQQGLGKSKVNIEIARMIDPDFSYETISWSTQGVLDKLKVFKDSVVFVKDESYTDFGEGSRRIKENFTMAIEVLRKDNKSFIISTPEYERVGGVHWNIEVLGRNDDKRITWCALREKSTNNCVGGLYFKAPPDSDPLWKAYSKEKDKFTELVKSQGIEKYNITEVAIKIIELYEKEDPDRKKFKNKGEREGFVYSKIPSFSVSEKKMIHREMERIMRLKDEGIEITNNNTL